LNKYKILSRPDLAAPKLNFKHFYEDEDEDNIIPNEDKSNEDTNDSNESIDEGFEDIVTSEGKHFYDNHEGENDTITKVTGMYKDWFLDYASYVILERAVPAIEDGFKPVQRRIMHSLKSWMMAVIIR
jgi:topoisomerase-4 subunit A